MAEWFKDWFNTKYYHILYKSRDFSEAEKFLHELVTNLGIDKQAIILDLACGRGRHSILLNKFGFRVHGVDLSPKSVQAAKEYERDGLSFSVQDMRTVTSETKFDAVFNLFTSFGYFENIEDNYQVIESVKEVLKPNGIFLIDFLNVSYVQENLVAHEEKVVEGITFTLKKRIENAHIIKEITFNADNHDYQFEEKVQTLKLSDFEKMFSKAGFIIEAVYGDYKLATFDTLNSPRLIIKARLK